jgi:hypothetical protein
MKYAVPNEVPQPINPIKLINFKNLKINIH